MGCSADMTLTVTGLIRLEVIEGYRAARWHRTAVSVVRIVTVVDMAVETVRPVEPGTSADEDSADEPVGAVVAVGSAVVGWVVEIAVWANRLGTDVDANGDLSVC
jgi:hypothetical protein